MTNKRNVAQLTKFDDPRRGIQTAAELCNKKFSNLKWLVPGIIPREGVIILVAPPKAGKSALILNIALANCVPMKVLGYFEIPQKINALYLDLESTERRTSSRIKSIIPTHPFPTNLDIVHKWPRWDKGGKSRLLDYLETTKSDMIVIDTLGTIQTMRTIHQAHSYALDQKDIDQFSTVSKQFNVPIILIHHTRKAVSKDWVDVVSGSHGLSGTVDTIIYLRRDRYSDKSLIHVTGRDIDEEIYELRFIDHTCRWIMLGIQSDLNGLSSAKLAVAETLNMHDKPMSPSEIAAFLDKSVGSVKKILTNLVADGFILKESHGQYVGRIH